jgi:hypothetical protein
LREAGGNIWNFNSAPTYGYVAIPTNGVVKANGRLVMGAGVAKQARDRFPGVSGYNIPSIDEYLGEKVKKGGNHVYLYDGGQHDTANSDFRCFSFPTKHHWRDPSDLDLIIQSWCELSQYACSMGIEVYMPRPGCGLGGLPWEEVKAALVPYPASEIIVVKLIGFVRNHNS